MNDQNTTAFYDRPLVTVQEINTVVKDTAAGANYGTDGKFELMETSNTGFFENIIEQTGATIGNAVQSVVTSGANAVNQSINNAAGTGTTTSTQPASTMTPQKWGMLALGVLAVVWIYRQSKK